MCRHISRPVLTDERVQTSAAGQVVPKLKTPCREEATHLGMSPLEFAQLTLEVPPGFRLPRVDG
jgi:hypothetical protein